MTDYYGNVDDDTYHSQSTSLYSDCDLVVLILLHLLPSSPTHPPAHVRADVRWQPPLLPPPVLLSPPRPTSSSQGRAKIFLPVSAPASSSSFKSLNCPFSCAINAMLCSHPLAPVLCPCYSSSGLGADQCAKRQGFDILSPIIPPTEDKSELAGGPFQRTKPAKCIFYLQFFYLQHDNC